MKFAIVLALIGLLATANAGESNNPCKAKGMFRANTGDVTSFIRAAGLAPYVELGVCLYIYAVGPNNLDQKSLDTLSSMVSTLTKPDAITPSSAEVTTLATSIFDNCVVREIELNYLCVGTPPGVYTDPRVRRRSRALLDDHFQSSELFPFFTRFAFSTSIKAKINTGPLGTSINTSGVGGSWQTVKFMIELCVDINRSGTFGLPGNGDLINTCGNLSFGVPAPPPKR